jgi:hypothetical protein
MRDPFENPLPFQIRFSQNQESAELAKITRNTSKTGHKHDANRKKKPFEEDF